MDSDFQKQHTYYNVKETLPIDISQDNITPLISSISKDKKKNCFSSQPFHKLRAQLELHGMAQLFQTRAGVRPLPTREQLKPTAMLDLGGSANVSLDKIKEFGVVCHLVQL